ncbi:hypothetical protein, conserved [Eimeria tenella]|uniref:Uncharacterized protein n=1 Tax=Eimeria tenella TaxID=5802 RepID=U6KZR7_EIMTE|nr:hypothetical protein, conserved [Eimeria tenella]CDJ43431.1 hypothetical protein, conserved [Eimeria tenella]|eukprot:XP_013234181.1 hypothetical protein, conserved [Eimeria tenella]
MRSQVLRTYVKKLKHLKKVLMKEIAQVEGPLWCVEKVLYPRPFCMRRCVRRKKYRCRLQQQQIELACIHLQQAIKAYLRWAGPDFRKFTAARQALGDKLPRMCARVKCGCCCKCCCSCCCCLYCCWKCCMRCCNCWRYPCYKLTCCCRSHPEMLQRRAVCRALCESLESELELLTAHLAASCCWLARSGQQQQLAELAVARGHRFLNAARSKLHQVHFTLCQRPSTVPQRLVEATLHKAQDDLENAKAIIGPLPFRGPRPYDRGPREHQLLQLPPEDGLVAPHTQGLEPPRTPFPLLRTPFSYSCF